MANYKHVTPPGYREISEVRADGVRIVVAVQGPDVIIATRKLSRFKAEQLAAGLLNAIRAAQAFEEQGQRNGQP